MLPSHENEREYVSILSKINLNCHEHDDFFRTRLLLILEVEFVGIQTILKCRPNQRKPGEDKRRFISIWKHQLIDYVSGNGQGNESNGNDQDLCPNRNATRVGHGGGGKPRSLRHRDTQRREVPGSKSSDFLTLNGDCVLG